MPKPKGIPLKVFRTTKGLKEFVRANKLKIGRKFGAMYQDKPPFRGHWLIRRGK